MSPRGHVKHPKNTLQKKAEKGFQGYPIATVAYYGPNDEFASKVAVGIIPTESGEVAALERWFSEKVDVRRDPAISQEIVAFIQSHNVKSVAITDRLIGCPHEEGKDYPKGEYCPQCPYWIGRDRWTGEMIEPVA